MVGFPFKRMVLGVLLAATMLLGVQHEALADRRVLTIPPVTQQSPVWCWAAVAEMYLRFKKVKNPSPAGNFQCAIVSLVHPACANACGNCYYSSAPYWKYIIEVIERFPVVAQSNNGLDLVLLDEPKLEPEDVVDRIKDKEPIVVGISPSGISHSGVPQHVALIVGYEYPSSGDPDSDMYLFVNDPYPNHPAQDPYLSAGGQKVSAGRYKIKYSDFEKLNWTKSAHN